MVNDGVIIPKQRSGGFNDTASSLVLDSAGAACEHFEIVKNRLININAWGDISNKLAEFRLTDAAGNEKTGEPEEGDHIRINLPAPGTDSSGNYEWVVIEYIIHKKSIMSDYESVALLVRPAKDPTSGKKYTAHFFSEDATSTFMVRRDNNTVSAEVHGRNEHPNTDVSSFIDKVRNVIMGIGAILGFSKVQWKSLVNGLIRI